MAKKVIKLTEAQLKSVVERVISEQAAPAPKLAPGQELIKGKDGRTQARRYDVFDLGEYGIREARESFTNYTKQIPVFSSTLRTDIIKSLKGLGLKKVNVPGFFKNTGDEGTLTHTFTTRNYYFEVREGHSNNPGKCGYWDVIYNIGANNPNATAEQIMEDIASGGHNGIIKYFKTETRDTIDINVADGYVALRQMVPAKNVVMLIARATKSDEYFISTWLHNILWNGADNQEPDDWGQTGGQKYKSYFDELKKLYSLDDKQ